VPDEPHRKAETDQAAASRFTDWLTGDEEGPPPEIDAPLQAHLIAETLERRLGQKSRKWIWVIERVVICSGAEVLLESILSENWEAIRDSFPVGPIMPDERQRNFYGSYVPRNLTYAVFSLIPNSTTHLRSLGAEELGYLEGACRSDWHLLRHLLTWASEQRENRPGEISIWQPVAKQVLKAIPNYSSFPFREISDVLSFSWEDPAGVSMARRMITDVPLDQLAEVGSKLCYTRLRFFAELSAVSVTHSQLLGADSDFVDELVEEVPQADFTLARTSTGLSPDYYVSLPLISWANLARHSLAFGWIVGSRLQADNLQRNPGAVAGVLQKGLSEVEGTKLCGVALLWADLRQLAEYEHEAWKHREKILGVYSRLSNHLASWPGAWAESAREILRHMDALGTNGSDLLALATVQHVAVRNVLQKLAEGDPEGAIRDSAAGVLARALGVPTPSEDLRRWLADSAARIFDGAPLFPRPLTPLAKTWLGSIEVEETLVRSLRHSMDQFRTWVISQGAATEELVTGALLRELESGFRNTSLRLESAGLMSLARAISVSQRPVSKTEEKKWGCDIALVLSVDIPQTVFLRQAELVQVKKSEAFARKTSSYPAEKWRIDVLQLNTLLKMSQSANYWLIASSGEILCVTGRWIRGLIEGRGGSAHGRVTIGYSELRHMAISIEQFLPEIFVGTWVGSNDEETLRFASGAGSSINPRHIFEISITASQDQR
jgi:hypothetical protein